MRREKRLSSGPSGTAPGEKPEADPDIMSSAYEEIRSAAENMDCDTLEALFEEMEQYSIPSDQTQLFDSLKDAASDLDYDKILTLLK